MTRAEIDYDEQGRLRADISSGHVIFYLRYGDGDEMSFGVPAADAEAWARQIVGALVAQVKPPPFANWTP